jgi:excisionase family DNA binding protein
MFTAPTSPYESYRRAEQRLRSLLFGDESDSPSVLRGGEDARLRVRAELRRMRQAVDELGSAPAEGSPAKPAEDLTDELLRDLLSPAEAAGALGISVSSIYRAVRAGDVRVVRLAGKKRGGMRIPASEVRRLAG